MRHRQHDNLRCSGVLEHRLLTAGGGCHSPGSLIGNDQVRRLGIGDGTAVKRTEFRVYYDSKHRTLVLPHSSSIAARRRPAGPHQKVCLSHGPLEPCERRSIGHRDLHFVGTILIGKHCAPVRILPYAHIGPGWIRWLSRAERMHAFQPDGHDRLGLGGEGTAVSDVVGGIERIGRSLLTVGLHHNLSLIPQPQAAQGQKRRLGVLLREIDKLIIERLAEESGRAGLGATCGSPTKRPAVHVGRRDVPLQPGTRPPVIRLYWQGIILVSDEKRLIWELMLRRIIRLRILALAGRHIKQRVKLASAALCTRSRVDRAIALKNTNWTV